MAPECERCFSSPASAAELLSRPQPVPAHSCFCGPDHGPRSSRLFSGRLLTVHPLWKVSSALAERGPGGLCTHPLRGLPPGGLSVIRVSCGPGANWTKNHMPGQTLRSCKSWLPLQSPTSPSGRLGQDTGDSQILPVPQCVSLRSLGLNESDPEWGEM